MKVSQLALIFLIYASINPIKTTTFTHYTGVVLTASDPVSAIAGTAPAPDYKYIDFKCGIKYCDNTRANCFLSDQDLTDLHPTSKKTYLYQNGSSWASKPKFPLINGGKYITTFLNVFSSIFLTGTTGTTKYNVTSNLKMVSQAIVHNFSFVRKSDGKYILYKFDVRLAYILGASSDVVSATLATQVVLAAYGTSITAPYWVTATSGTTMGTAVAGVTNLCLTATGVGEIVSATYPLVASGSLASDAVTGLASNVGTFPCS